MEDKIAPHLDEIIRALGTVETKIDKGIIQQEFERLLDFKVPLAEAKRSLLKKYGASEVSEVKKMGDLRGGERNIEITGRILDVNLKVVGTQGQERSIYMGNMADETGVRSFTAWEDFGLEKGDVIRVVNAYTRLWQGMPEVNFGPRSKVEKLKPDVLESIKALDNPTPLAQLEDGASAVRAVFKIIESGEQEINTKNGPKSIITGIAADASAKLPFTSWVPGTELAAGNTVEVENAYIKSWRGVPTINMGEFTTIRMSDRQLSEDDISGVLNQVPVRLDNITNRGGAFDVIIEGSLISVRPGSGLIVRCPECSRVIQKNVCRIHGNVDGIYDLRIKSILDDGTGALTVVLDTALTEKVTGYSIKTAQEVAAANLEDEIRKKLLGRTMRFRGNMTRGEYGITLVASDAIIAQFDASEAAEDLIKKWGGKC